MVTKHLWAALVALVLFVGGCGPVYETQYTLVPPKGPQAQMCVGQCNQMSGMCKQNCRLSEQNCRAEQHIQAEREYREYVRERRREKAPVKKSVSDFEHMWRCSNSSCEANCGDEFRSCFSGCGGQVIPQRVCTAFCK